MIKWGLCCIFRREPVKFRRATVSVLRKYPRREQLQRLNEIVRDNAENLRKAFESCIRLEITAFRINSELMPLATHPEVGYRLEDLPEAERITGIFAKAREYAVRHGLRLSFHPDQFVVLNSPRREVVENSLLELRHQNFLAELCGAREINLHAGGVYGNKAEALARLRQEILALPDDRRRRLTLENDDRSYTVADLLPLCRELNVPLVYDVHHHRVNADDLSIEHATEETMKTWSARGLKPHFHLSSPLIPWDHTGDHRLHADFIDPADVPPCWRDLDATVDVEAKAKEEAILKLRQDLAASLFFTG